MNRALRYDNDVHAEMPRLYAGYFSRGACMCVRVREWVRYTERGGEERGCVALPPGTDMACS